MASNKVQVIQDWPEPQKIKDIQSFLGFANFYWCFIPKYSEITIPLTHLTCKGTAWDFSEKCHSAFTSLKQAFTTTLILAHWIPGILLIVEMDTSDYTLAAILSTISPTDGKIHPIAFHSQTFTTPELNYDIHDKELLAIFEAFKSGVITSRDHQPRSTWLWIIKILSTFLPLNYSPADKSDGPNSSANLTSLSDSILDASVPNPTLLLDYGTSILKRGEAIMPA